MPTTNRKPAKLEPSIFRDSWRNLLRITTTRIFVQTVVFLLFLSFVLLNTFANLDQFPGLRR